MIVSTITRLSEWLNGMRKLTEVNIHAQARSTRRGPRSPPRYTENGPINIIDALNEVLIHDASSTPRWKAPLMSARPTLINRPVHVAIIAPSSTPATPSNGWVVSVGLPREKHDLDRHSLHNLCEIAGRIVRR